ncbi:MAG: SDR family NAD(P)-dependent oxidoreductase [Prochlorotrichaceae cyanobacterium]|jgi:NAD(P)-dependent dehydrogenase (short-subunit alcohol dehydrogenase family)
MMERSNKASETLNLQQDRTTVANFPGPQGVVTGASRGIGLEFVRQLLSYDKVQRVFAVSRQVQTAELLALQQTWGDRLILLPGDMTEEAEVAEIATQVQTYTTQLHWVINTIGVLQEPGLSPEKSLRQIEAAGLLRSFAVNSIPTVLLAKHFLPLLRHPDRSIFAVLSAKVGSIGDNRLGGWYGYRASKAALNMFIKTIALEYQRRSPQTIVLALHPGTTDTQLSKPFQGNVPTEQLFSVERTVRQLITVIDGTTSDQSGSFFAWDGSILPW